jgi:hypothetical protein
MAVVAADAFRLRSLDERLETWNDDSNVEPVNGRDLREYRAAEGVEESSGAESTVERPFHF